MLHEQYTGFRQIAFYFKGLSVVRIAGYFEGEIYTFHVHGLTKEQIPVCRIATLLKKNNNSILYLIARFIVTLMGSRSKFTPGGRSSLLYLAKYVCKACFQYVKTKIHLVTFRHQMFC